MENNNAAKKNYCYIFHCIDSRREYEKLWQLKHEKEISSLMNYSSGYHARGHNYIIFPVSFHDTLENVKGMNFSSAVNMQTCQSFEFLSAAHFGIKLVFYPI